MVLDSIAPLTSLPAGSYMWQTVGDPLSVDGCLSPGRWHFSISGGSFMQESAFKLKLSVTLTQVREYLGCE
jgi:hypothetical protein